MESKYLQRFGNYESETFSGSDENAHDVFAAQKTVILEPKNKEDEAIIPAIDVTGIRNKLLNALKNQILRFDNEWNPIKPR